MRSPLHSSGGGPFSDGCGRGTLLSRRGEIAISRIGAAIMQVRGIDLRLKGTWGAYDLEWVREIGLAALRRRFCDVQR